MSKAVLLSIQPRWCEKIASGRKTIEVRKTRPKLQTPFKCYIYCTSCKSFYSIGSLRYGDDELYRIPSGKIKYGTSVELMAYGDDKYGPDNFLNRKVMGEFVCDKIFDIYEFSGSRFWLNEALLKDTCLSYDEIKKYAGNAKEIYGWHISDLVIYDRPKELSEFKSRQLVWRGNDHIHVYEQAERPPQSWCYVEELA